MSRNPALSSAGRKWDPVEIIPSLESQPEHENQEVTMRLNLRQARAGQVCQTCTQLDFLVFLETHADRLTISKASQTRLG